MRTVARSRARTKAAPSGFKKGAQPDLDRLVEAVGRPMRFRLAVVSREHVSVGVQVMNALLLPVVLGFLYLLARRLPVADRVRGTYAIVVLVVIVVTTVLGVISALSGVEIPWAS